jgi:tRNA/tmRNA/rRNA uracil-C5-methylase (TrmA/RlmC/RlmD family)
MPRSYDVTPEGWLSRGDAFVSGRGNQLAVFGAIPGEHARVTVFSSTQHQALARWIRADRPSPHRVAPPCDRYGNCGGCPWMHLDRAGEDAARDRLLRDALRDVGLPENVAPTVGGVDRDVVAHLSLVAGWSDQRSPRLGAVHREGDAVVPIPECLVVTPALRRLMSAASHLMRELEVSPWDGRSGTLRGLEAIQAGDTIAVALDVARPSKFVRGYADRLADAVPEVRGVSGRCDGETQRLAGDPKVMFRLGEAEIAAAPGEVGWSDPAVVARMLGGVASGLRCAAHDAVLDVHCGVGASTVVLGKAAGWVLGLDLDTARAQENVAHNKVAAELAFGPVEHALADAAPRLKGRRPLVHVRAAHRALSPELRAALRELAPRRLAVTSENPRALADEARAWVAAGFSPGPATPYRTRPWSPLGESLVVLSAPDADAAVPRAPRRRAVR